MRFSQAAALWALLIAIAPGCEAPSGGSSPALSEAPPDAGAEFVANVGRDPASPGVYEVRFDTSAGEFLVEVHRDWAPRGADRFYRLVKDGYFDNVKFFRVVDGFVVQFGMSGDPAQNKIWRDAKFADDPVRETNAPGTLTFATSGPNSRTTQLFINLGDNTRLDRMGFSPFGKVVKGMNVVTKLYSGYGELPDQGLIHAEGNKYLEARFPKLDGVKTARVISENGTPVDAGAPATALPATK